MRLHHEFECDPKKAALNRKKHGIGFELAALVLADPDGDQYHIEDTDDEHSIGEDRFVTFGSNPADRSIVLRISWTDRSKGKTRITRIISARLATKRERKWYGDETSGK